MSGFFITLLGTGGLIFAIWGFLNFCYHVCNALDNRHERKLKRDHPMSPLHKAIMEMMMTQPQNWISPDPTAKKLVHVPTDVVISFEHRRQGVIQVADGGKFEFPQHWEKEFQETCEALQATVAVRQMLKKSDKALDTDYVRIEMEPYR